MIEGGGLKSPWVLDCMTLDGSDFVALSLGDRSLAKAMGMVMAERAPLAGCSIFPHMVRLRDNAVDAFIRSSSAANDPMADVVEDTSAVPTRGRPMLFANAQVPAVIEIAFDAFVTPEGKRIEAHSMRVVTTPKRGFRLTIEAAPANFKWLMHACQVDWADTSAPKKRELPQCSLDGLPELEAPLKYHRDRADNISIMCNFRSADGSWHRHFKRLDTTFMADTVVMQGVAKHCAETVIDFYNEYHHDAPESGVEVAPAPLADVGEPHDRQLLAALAHRASDV